GHRPQRPKRSQTPQDYSAAVRPVYGCDHGHAGDRVARGHQAVRHPKGGIYTALRDLTLEVANGEFCAVVGPTGCGKSTTLALISGLEPASTGEVRVEGRPVKGIADGVGYVFQGDAVFPWKTVLENVAAGPRYHGTPPREARVR